MSQLRKRSKLVLSAEKLLQLCKLRKFKIGSAVSGISSRYFFNMQTELQYMIQYMILTIMTIINTIMNNYTYFVT